MPSLGGLLRAGNRPGIGFMSLWSKPGLVGNQTRYAPRHSRDPAAARHFHVPFDAGLAYLVMNAASTAIAG
jgi:hypothetical protein